MPVPVPSPSGVSQLQNLISQANSLQSQIWLCHETGTYGEDNLSSLQAQLEGIHSQIQALREAV